MKTKYLLGALLVSTFASTSAQSLFDSYKACITDPQRYVCYRTEGDMKIDGKLTEGAWTKAAFTTDFADISGEGFATPKYRTRAKMLWDDKYFYVGAVIEEPDIEAKLKNRDDIIYHDNDFEIFLNPNGDAADYFEIETNALGTIFDLFLDRSYRCNGNFFTQWDCPGIKLAVYRDGTLNKPGDTDRYWSVEVAIPHDALKISFDNALKRTRCWRVNFSRVEWLKKKGPEENWVWSPTGKINMHMPERWGYVYLVDAPVGSQQVETTDPYNMSIYKLLWTMFYAEQDAYQSTHRYLHSVADFALTQKELTVLPQGAMIDVGATSTTFDISISDSKEGKVYRVNSEGRFSVEKIK